MDITRTTAVLTKRPGVWRPGGVVRVLVILDGARGPGGGDSSILDHVDSKTGFYRAAL